MSTTGTTPPIRRVQKYKQRRNGLIPVQSGETSIALVDDEGQLQGYINVEEIVDANGNKSFNNEIEFLAKADGTYLLTMTVDEFNNVEIPSNMTLSYSSQYYAKPMGAFVRGCLRNYKDESLTATVNQLRGICLRSTTETATSSNIHVRIWHSTNHSSNKPYLTIYYNTNFGAATIYRAVCEGDNPNCLGYALEKSQWILNVGTYSNASDQEIADAFITEVNIPAHADNIRLISSQTAAISDSEYRIAMRFDRTASGTNGANFHVLVQLNDGSWAHKMGNDASEYLGHIDPDIGTDDGYWHSNPDSNNIDYHTRTLYFAVDPLRD